MSRGGRTSVRFWDPEGRRHARPTYPWALAPEGLATARQLRAQGLRPGGQDIAAQICWRGIGGVRVAFLYRIDLAKPKRTATPAQLQAIAAALEARRACPECGLLRPYYISPVYRCCWTCAGLDPIPPAGRTRHRTRAGIPQHGKCVICQHRTWHRHHGQWSHDVCAHIHHTNLRGGDRVITDVPHRCWTIIDTRFGEPLDIYDQVPHLPTAEDARHLLTTRPWSDHAQWATVLPEDGPCVAITCNTCDRAPDAGGHYTTRATAIEVATSEAWYITTTGHTYCAPCTHQNDCPCGGDR